MSLRLNRRVFLKGMLGGAAASLALPILEIMMNNHGNAFASGEALPKRFGFWFWGNGAMSPRFNPTGTATSWAISPQLQPLADLQPYLSVPTRFEVKCSNFQAHNVGALIVYHGAQYFPIGSGYPYPDGNYPTLPEIVANAWQGRTPHRMIRCGVSKNYTWAGVNNQWTYGDMTPRELFNRLFGSGVVAPTYDNAAAIREVDARSNVLDAVLDDARRLKSKVGREDQRRIDRHLATIADIQARLMAPEPTSQCTTPGTPNDIGGYVANHEDLEYSNDTMADIIAAAFACDLTRVLDMQFTKHQVNTVYWQVGATQGQHDITHEYQTELHHNIVLFVMTRLGKLLRKLRDTPEGDSNLLAQSVILATSEQDSGELGVSHGTTNHPLVLAGRAGGALKGGILYQSPSNENICKAHMTCLKALDINQSFFGNQDSGTAEWIPSFLT